MLLQTFAGVCDDNRHSKKGWNVEAGTAGRLHSIGSTKRFSDVGNPSGCTERPVWLSMRWKLVAAQSAANIISIRSSKYESTVGSPPELVSTVHCARRHDQGKPLKQTLENLVSQTRAPLKRMTIMKFQSINAPSDSTVSRRGVSLETVYKDMGLVLLAA